MQHGQPTAHAAAFVRSARASPRYDPDNPVTSDKHVMTSPGIPALRPLDWCWTFCDVVGVQSNEAAVALQNQILGGLVSSLPPLAPMATGNSSRAGRQGVRPPKTAELVARTLRQMIVDGKLKEGDFLPNEAELMNHFGVSRPTLREAVRVLESERLVEVRRGSRTGARVRVPGPEIIARPTCLLLELSGATIADVLVARSAIEPMAACLLATNGKAKAFDELEQILLEDISTSLEPRRFAVATAQFHRRLVELSGNATLSMIAGMLHEITERHTALAVARKRSVPKSDYEKVVRSYRHLIKLLRARDGAAAEAHWRRHMDNARQIVLRGLPTIKVRDVMD